ncbi:prolyl oligopeptidase family serine peptidase [Parapedobacter pyrenivorans]|uniref:carboxylesterase family protein n=1 Tax=Parapedobacter pyrenivorans TaxID=1305674 RepID=UPI00333FAAE5
MLIRPLLLRIGCSVITVSLAFAAALYAQTTHRFTEGLSVQAPANYGREAVYTDVLLWHYYQGNISTPKPGQSIGESDTEEPLVWTSVAADTSGFFRPQPGAGGNLNSPNDPAGPGRIDRRTTSARQPAPQRRRWGPAYLYLTYPSAKAQSAVLNIRGNSAVLINGELHAGDPYRMGWMHIPLQLKKGLNEFYVRGLFVAATLDFPAKPTYLNTDDLTLPDIVQGKDKSSLLAGVVIVNASSKNLVGLTIGSATQGQKAEADVPAIPPYSTRKIAVPINASMVTETGDVQSQITLSQKGKALDQRELSLRSVEPTVPYRVTFVSEIDGTIQYYAVNPATGGEKPGDALFLSVHGAGVEAIGQAQAYQSKDWGTLVAPTNRRPRGFNWEDWGRLDALEVLALAKEALKPDTQRIYLTGHSMGGHGTWFLGATYPDKWAAIAPCAGYPTLMGYGSADGLIPKQGRNALENLLLRSSNQSNVPAYATNYKPLGVYVLHGDADRTVPVSYARQMRDTLGRFHPNFSYYEYPGGSHWYSNESVDWKPLFDYFSWHKRKVDTAVHHIDFITSNPGISASYYWATIYQQQTPLEYARIILDRNLQTGEITGTTKNADLLQLDVSAFAAGQSLTIRLDSLSPVQLVRSSGETSLFLKKSDNSWQRIDQPGLDEKGPHRNGTFKEAFNHRMVYVYGTKGNALENQWALEKVRYDAESWYYRGNGAFDIIPDHAFKPEDYADRNIILIGNANTNSVWNTLLADCPIQVSSGNLIIGKQHVSGSDLGGYFTWKIPGSNTRTVGVITGTGLKGMQAATANQYFAGASGFPDYLFFSIDMLTKGPEGILDAGFYDNNWQISKN